MVKKYYSAAVNKAAQNVIHNQIKNTNIEMFSKDSVI